MDALAATCEHVAAWNSRLRKIAMVADYLRTLDDADLGRAVRFLCCGPIIHSGSKFSLGGATLREALSQVVPWDQTVLGICYREVGDIGETARHLLNGNGGTEAMTLADADMLYARLYKMRTSAAKAALMADILRRHRPATVKYFIKVITGDLRIGLQAKMLEEAVAAATGAPLEDVRRANNRIGDLPAVALAARRGTLHEVAARMFHAMDFMLAKPLDNIAELPDPENWWVESKYDGFRAQIHLHEGRVLIFTRGMEDATASFPDLVARLQPVACEAVLDGEIVAWQDGRALPFNVLQQRIARKKLPEKLMAEIPVEFIAYDILYRGGEMLVDEPLERRREHLVDIAACGAFRTSPVAEVTSTHDIETRFAAAREEGNEGLVLKRRGSLYEPGKRGGAWLKVKRPMATLDVVVTAAEQGSGRRATMLSDYTFAVRDGERFLNVGKAYSGLTDDEVRQLTRILRAAALDRFGRVMLVKPEVVLEVAFDTVQKSPRHKSGYALRFPRIVRWRRDKTPDDCDTLDRVRELYESTLVLPARP